MKLENAVADLHSCVSCIAEKEVEIVLKILFVRF